jgi:hypothetical protein
MTETHRESRVEPYSCSFHGGKFKRFGLGVDK